MQAMEVSLRALAQPGANILLPRPGFPFYEAIAAHTHVDVRHFGLLPEKGWKVDLEVVEALADENTVALVIINPGNPCGTVFSYQNVAKTARKLGILVIADEVYGYLTFGSTPFVPMGAFGSIVPALTVGSISNRWIVPGWRIGWLVTTDPKGILRNSGIVESIVSCLNVSLNPSIFIQVQLNLSLLEGINDNLDFCLNLAKEESVIVLPGIAVGMKNWLHVTFAIEPSALEDGLARIKAFCGRHAKKQ